MKTRLFRFCIIMSIFIFLSVNAVKGNVDGTGNSDKQELNQVIEYLDKLIIDLAGKDEFSGTILVAKDGKPFYKKAVGEANKSYGIPNKLDTKFNLASMNKMFTGTSII
ncbi:MAG: serine hydrolase, partial [bacterium]|nr:serine hydrolase [bacterium]